jgi:exosortase A
VTRAPDLAVATPAAACPALPAGALRCDPVTAFAWVATILLAVFALHGPTTWAMVNTWSTSDTYAHGFIVLPIVLGWCWARRVELARLRVQPSWPALGLLAAAGAVWWLFDGIGANAPSQFAVVAMAPLAVAGMLGTAWVRALALPLAFLFFAVPAGDALVPYLTEWTADFVVASLQFVGIPVYREADSLLIPSGYWTVKESCSGIRYLMACATLGTLYAAMSYRSALRRLMFVACMVAFAVVANWVRAFGIVMLAHLTDNRLALGVDHLVYGWLFFGLILLVAFWLGRLWREGERLPDVVQPRPAAAAAAAPSPRPAAAVALSTLALAIWPLLSWIEPRSADDPVAALSLESTAGWTALSGPPVAWRPLIANPVREQLLAFQRAGSRVWLHAGVYRGASRQAKATSSANRLMPVDSRDHRMVDSANIVLPLPGEDLTARAVRIVTPAERVVVVQFFWIDGMVTSSRVRATLEEMRSRLLLRQTTSVWLALVTDDGEASDRVLAEFVRDMGPALARAMQGLRAR